MPVNGAWSFEQTLNGGQLGFTIGTILAIFDLQVTPMLPTKFRVNWPFGSKEEAKNRFSRWLPWLPPWISDWHDFSYFFIYKSPICLLKSLESICLSVHEKKLNIVQEKKLNIDFQDRGHGGHLGFQIGTILAIFDLLVTPMLPTKFGVNWLLGFRIRTILAIFDLQVTQMLPSKFGVNWPFGSREEAKNRFSRWRPSWIFDQHDFSYF